MWKETRPAVGEDLILVGLIGMIDPARAEAREAVPTALAAGIRPVMITGDQPLTAASIAVAGGHRDARSRRQHADFRVLTGAGSRLALA